MAIVTGNPIGLLLTLTYTVSGTAYTPNWLTSERRYYMNFARQQSTTNYPIIFWMADSADHVTGKTGLSPTVTISKNGGAFGAAAGAVSEIANGWYSLAGNATDRNTLGSLAINAAATGADDADLLAQIVEYDPFGFAADMLTITDSVPADGSLPTVNQALYMVWQFLSEKSVSGTTVTVKKADGTTSLMTFTLDDATTPNSITRAS